MHTIIAIGAVQTWIHIIYSNIKDLECQKIMFFQRSSNKLVNYILRSQFLLVSFGLLVQLERLKDVDSDGHVLLLFIRDLFAQQFLDSVMFSFNKVITLFYNFLHDGLVDLSGSSILERYKEGHTLLEV